jgi:hypothetical protein
MRGLSAHGLRFVLVLALALAQGLAPSLASAWTAATVRTAHADVELLPDGRAHVAMTIRVRVDGGWLEGLEIEGLDRDAVLDPDRPLTFRDASGIALPVEVTARDGGRVSLRFARRAAPRRGEYEVDLAWSTALGETSALDADTLEARWIFPAWHYGLDGVEIRWIVPEGSTQQPDDEITAPIEIEVSPLEDARLAITHRRAHLPRTSDWETVVRVPRAAWPHPVDGASEAPDEPSARAAASPEAPSSLEPASSAGEPAGDRTTWLGLALAIALAALLKRGDLEARARRSRRVARWLVSTPRWLHALACAALAAVGAATYALGLDASYTLVAAGVLVTVSWQAATQHPPRPRLLSLSPVSSSEIVRARRERWLDWLLPSAWVEPSRLGVPTLALAASVVIGADSAARALGALLVAIVASGARARFGEMPTQAIRVLSSAMESLRVDLGAPHVSVRLLGRGAYDALDVRLHVSLAADDTNARVLEDLRVELVADGEALALRVAAREDTAADVALRAWAASELLDVHAIARRRAVLVPCASREVGRSLERVVRGVIALAPYGGEDATLRDEALLDAAE